MLGSRFQDKHKTYFLSQRALHLQEGLENRDLCKSCRIFLSESGIIRNLVAVIEVGIVSLISMLLQRVGMIQEAH